MRRRNSVNLLTLGLVLVLGQMVFPAPSVAATSVGKPIATPVSLTVGQAMQVTVTSQVTGDATNPVIATGVNLLRVDASNKVLATIGTMRDDGTGGDATAGDGTFTLRFTTTEPAAGALRLQVSAAFKGLLKRVLSEVTVISIVALDPNAIDDDKDGFNENQGDCNDANAAVHPGVTELCNDADDNCNGTKDEEFDVGSACTSGVGACARNGTKVCKVDGTGTSCNATPGSPTAEVCNNVDDNCNGQVDEGVGQTQTCGVGACERTVSSCTNGQPGECVPGSPTAEVCENGIDEDCNGTDLICVVTLDIAITSPANLTSTNQPTIAVSGTVDPTATEVTCNGRLTGINANGFGGNVPLEEGSNLVTCVAQDAAGNVGSASISVTLDSTPPRVTINSPQEGATLTASPVTVTGIINDIVVGTVNQQEAQVECNGVSAQIANRTFLASSVSLTPGINTIICTGTDRVGNVDSGQVQVTLATPTGPKLTLVSGNNQTGPIGTVLPAPLIVALTDNGLPMGGRTVFFRVLRNDGTLSVGSLSGRFLPIVTDANGQAQVDCTLGTWAGAGNNQVQATAPGITGEVLFSASALPGSEASIVVDAGNLQFGVVGQPLPKPFIAVVIDRGSNRLGGVPVTFTVVQGGGNFGGQSEITINTDSDGRAQAVLTLGPDAGFDNNMVSATFPNSPATAAVLVASGKVAGDPAQTKISGVVLDNSNIPIQGVTLHVEGTSLTTQSDAQGQFVLQPAPIGKVLLVADGATAQRPGTWPKLEYELVTIAGRDNTIGMPIFLLPLDLANGLLVDETNGGTLTLPEVPGFSLTIVPGSATFPDGSKRGTVSVTMVHPDKVPMVPNFGQQPRFIVTIQPAGVHFNPPAAMTVPNADGFAPGQKTEMYSFDHDLGSFVSIGPGTVSDDGLVIASDPGVGVIKGGWHCGGNPAGSGACEHACDDGNDCTIDEPIIVNGTVVGCHDIKLHAPDGTPCRDAPQSFTCGPGINIKIDDSCRGRCFEGDCLASFSVSRSGINKVRLAVLDTCGKIFDPDAFNCMGEPLRTKMQDRLVDKGFKIECIDSPNGPGGKPACGYAYPGSTSLTITNQETSECGSSLAGTIRHEMQHAAGVDVHEYKPNPSGTGFVLDCANDSVYACDLACYQFSNCPGAQTANCK